jgi:hypothetical protein
MTILRCSRGWSAGPGHDLHCDMQLPCPRVGHVALLLGLTHIGASAVQPIAPEAMIVEIVPPSEAPASPARRHCGLKFPAAV